MLNTLAINIKNNFLLYRRSKLLIILGIILFVFYGLTSLPMLIAVSFTAKVSGISSILARLHNFSSLFLAVVLLVGLYYPIKNRCLKMIITKPCPPETWLLSNYISSILIALVINILIFIIACLFFLIWDLGFQLSLVYIFFDQFLRLVIMLSYLTFLMMVFGTWGAVIFGLFLTDSFFFYITNLFLALYNSATSGAVKTMNLVIHKIFYFIYTVIPMADPFSKETNLIYRNFKIELSDWEYILYTLIYTIFIAGFFYLVNSFLLKRKRLT